METITFQYNPADTMVARLIDMLRAIKNIRITTDTATDTPNRETLQAIRDAQNGNVFHADSTDDLFHQILG